MKHLVSTGQEHWGEGKGQGEGEKWSVWDRWGESEDAGGGKRQGWNKDPPAVALAVLTDLETATLMPASKTGHPQSEATGGERKSVVRNH